MLKRPLFLILAAFALASSSMASSALAQDGGQRLVSADVSEPLPQAAHDILNALPNEQTPRTERFYFRSNEWRQDLLRPHLEGRGGAYVGVASDQGYTMAAMAGCEMMFMVDFDRRIKIVHEIYKVLVPRSADADALIAYFAEENIPSTLALLREHLPEGFLRDRGVYWLNRYNVEWHRYLRRVKGLVRDGRPFSWLSDPALFNHIKQLHTNGRIVARTGDVTATTTLRAVGTAAQQLGTTVRMVYFSNAEQFFRYTPDFIANMENLPTDDRSVVVRTIRHRRIANADDGRWHFMVHDFGDFVERIKLPPYRRSFSFTADLLRAGAPHLGREISTMTRETPRALLERRRSGRR